EVRNWLAFRAWGVHPAEPVNAHSSMSLRQFLLLFLAVLGCLSSAPALAGGTFSFTLDNDLYFGTDREYSNGGLFTYTADEGQAPDFLRDVLAQTVAPDAFQFRYSLGQLIYTPVDKQATAPVNGERPYVGLLFGQIDAIFEKGTAVHRLSLVLGMFGPPAIAGEVQNFVHSIRDIPRVEGWDNQIGFEPALNLNYDVAVPLRLVRDESFGVELEPYLGLSFGNVSTSARAGFVWRFGPDLEGQPSALSIRQGHEAPRIFRPKKALRWHIHAGAAGEVEAYSTIVDGNVFRSSRSAPGKTLQWEGRFGIMSSIGRYWLGVGMSAISRRHDFQERTFHRIGEIRFGISLF
ncbi:MAG: lipid A deacylase LpxR family protein, partial [Pseudomonadota bacterium]